MIAAFSDFDVGAVFRREPETWGVVVGDVFGLESDEVLGGGVAVRLMPMIFSMIGATWVI